MRIAVVNNFYPPRVGGSSHLASALATGYARRGHDVLVITAAYENAPAEEVRNGVRIVRLPAVMLPETRLAVSFDLSFATRPSLQRRLRELLDDFQPDVIHQHGQFMDLTWATGRYARSRNIPALLSIHTRLENPVARYRRVFAALDRFVVRPQLKRWRPRLVVMDAYMHDYIRDRYEGAYAGLEFIPVGVDPEWVRGGSREVGREQLDVAPDHPLILSIGHVIPLRDRIGLVEAMPAVLEHFPDTVLAVVGTVYYPVFSARARELGIEDSVRSIGPVAKGSIPDLLAAADVEAHEQGDGLGTATLEAMAAGVPVVGWGRNDNFPWIELEEGVDVFLTGRGDVPGLAKRLIKVLQDPELGRRVGANASAIIDEHFSIDRVLDQHLACLQDMAGQHPASSRTGAGRSTGNND